MFPYSGFFIWSGAEDYIPPLGVLVHGLAESGHFVDLIFFQSALLLQENSITDSSCPEAMRAHGRAQVMVHAAILPFVAPLVSSYHEWTLSHGCQTSLGTCFQVRNLCR